MLSSRSHHRPVRQLHRRRRDGGRRRRGALAAALPLRAAGLLPRPGRLPRRDEHHPPRPDPDAAAAHDRGRAGDEAVRAADRLDLAAALADFDRTDLSSLRKGYYGASIMPVEVLREMQRRLPDVRLWNFYGQTEMAPLATVLRPEDQVRKRRLRRPPGAQRRDAAGRRRRRGRGAGRDRRDRAPQPARDARLLERRGEDRGGVPRRLVPLAATSACSTTRATSPSSTARRT